MAPPAAQSSFDVAFWFMERAAMDAQHLQPQKLHRLMYLAQAYFAVAYNGRLLMPAIFVATELGPIEPNVFRACAINPPAIEPMPMTEAVTHFLDSIWRKFGPHSADYLNKQVMTHAPFADALAKGQRTIISLRAMMDFYGKKPNGTGPGEAEPVTPITQVLRPQVMRSQNGPVSVHKWMPTAKPKK